MVNIAAGATGHKPKFVYAPDTWCENDAIQMAQQEGIELTPDHWRVLQALQEYFVRHEDTHVNARKLYDALEEKFHIDGGMKYLYRLFPGGPIAQGGRIAGLPVPAGSTDKSFGSVQ